MPKASSPSAASFTWKPFCGKATLSQARMRASSSTTRTQGRCGTCGSVSTDSGFASALSSDGLGFGMEKAISISLSEFAFCILHFAILAVIELQIPKCKFQIETTHDSPTHLLTTHYG